MTFKQAQPGTEVTVQNEHSTWQGEIIKKVEGSHTKVIVQDTDCGPGWDETKQRYTGCYRNGFTGGAWHLGKNYDFGTEHIVHINKLGNYISIYPKS